MGKYQKTPNKDDSLKRKIDKYFSSPDPLSWKIGQQICHEKRVDYWVIVGDFYKTTTLQSGQRSRTDKIIKRPVAFSCFKLRVASTYGIYNPYRRVWQPEGVAYRYKITFKNNKDAKNTRT